MSGLSDAEKAARYAALDLPNTRPLHSAQKTGRALLMR